MPLVNYSPETSLGFGITVQYIFRFKSDTLGKISMAGLPALYTLRKQFVINPTWDFYIRKEKFRLTGSFDYRKYPEFFYGIGNFNKESSKETLTAQYLLFEHRFLVRVRYRLYVGAQHRYEYAYDVQYKKNGIADTTHVPGIDGYRASGIGVTAIYDSREHSMYPLKGAYVIFGNYFYFKQIGSKVTVMNFEVDARKYFNLGGMHVIALQGLFKFNQGAPTYKMMAMMGGAETMRGYYLGKFRDRHLLAGQVEYRFPIWWRFMGAAFFGMGEVTEKMEYLTFKGIKYSYGGGIRMTMDKKERINLRFDAGFGVEGSRGFYFQINQAF